MVEVNIWPQLGFRQSPYQTTPLPSDDEGARLLVGRDWELSRLRRAITTGVAHASLDGLNGVGKTSLVSVAAQELRRQRIETPSLPPFYPVKRSLNVRAGIAGETVLQDAILEIAQTLMKVADDIGPSLSSKALDQLKDWLNSPTFKSVGGGGSALGFGATGSRAESPNSSVGFERSGLTGLVLDALAAYFPSHGSGGIVVVLENVELAGDRNDVTRLLESIRDPLFTCPGLRWIVSGANGAVGVASGSARLDGIIAPPIHLHPLGDEDASSVVDTRIDCYKTRGKPDTPVDGEGFAYLYSIARGNLRTALQYSDEFSTWAYQADTIGGPASERLVVLRSWLVSYAEERLSQLDPIDASTWRAFDEVSRWPDGIARADAQNAADAAAYMELQRRGLLNLDGDPQTARLSRLGWLITQIPPARRA